MILLIFTFKYLKKISKDDVIAGIWIGAVLALSYGLQTIGLKTITSSGVCIFNSTIYSSCTNINLDFLSKTSKYLYLDWNIFFPLLV